VALLAAAARASADGVACSGATSVSIAVAWDTVPETDLYYVAVAYAATARPFAIQTSAGTNLTLIDLKPGTTYYLSLKSHPSSEPTIAWAPGWRDPSEPIACTTTKSPASAPADVVRTGELADTSIALSWAHPARPGSTFEIGVLKAEGCVEGDCTDHRRGRPVDWDWSGANVELVTMGTAHHGAALTGLEPGRTYFVSVRRSASGVASDPVPFRTKKADLMYTTAYRISEYAMDVDFLENHNSATIDAMPLYLMTCSPEGNCQPWNKTQFTPTDAAWDQCHTQLQSLCGDTRGTGFNGCVECVDGHRDAVVAGPCGNYTDADKEHPGFPVHYFCGIGWPENLMYFSAITEYCVEHQPAPKSDPRWEGYADYISCNSDEVDAAFNNSANDPTCMCWVWDDRQMSLLPGSELNKSCGSHMPWFVHEPICNCTDSKKFPDSTAILPSNPSYAYVGAMPVMQPYGFYQKPQEEHAVRIPSGDNLSTPKRGSCKENAAPGDNGCTWKRSPASRVMYGPDLFAAGWDDRWIPDTLHNQSHSNANKKKFADAVHLHDSMMSPRCCGC
jgi:hypothetical protein